MPDVADLIPSPVPRAVADLLRGLNGARVIGDGAARVHALTHDSRDARPGGMFVALRGGYVDGHNYLADARARGASVAVIDDAAHVGQLSDFAAGVVVDNARAALAVLAANWFDHPSRELTLVGVTGTDGKTTTCHMIEAICRESQFTTGMIGTVTIRIGDRVDQHESRQTTPESLRVQGYLAAMRVQRARVAIVEATSHGLAMHRLDECAFDVGVVTNITHEHLDFHGTVERYREAKGQLFQKVAAARQLGKLGIAVTNLHDTGARAIAPWMAGCDVLSYSLDGDNAASISATDIQVTHGGTTFMLHSPAGSHPISIHLPGRYNVANALAATGAGMALGLDLGQIARGLDALRAVPGRMEVVDAGQPYTVIVDYAHTPEALASVLREARVMAGRLGRVLVLFGSAGERDVEKRPIQGRVAQELADVAVFTSEDPRFEDPDKIIAEIAAGAEGAGGRRSVDFECIEDRSHAIVRIFERARPGDVVVLAGKGHEHSMIYGAEFRPWSDADAARLALADLGYVRNATGAS